jgi:hypothetical protein
VSTHRNGRDFVALQALMGRSRPDTTQEYTDDVELTILRRRLEVDAHHDPAEGRPTDLGESSGGEDAAAAGDLMVLAQLEKNGADLTQSSDLVHYLYVPSQDAAEKAAAELRSRGYTAEAKLGAGVQPTDPNPW